MKNECDIITDLLFGYKDDILSDSSKDLVEEHLKRCEKCQKNLEEIQQENNEKDSTKDIDVFKKINKKINKKNMIIVSFFIILIIIILFNIQVYKNYKSVASTMEIYLNDEITDEQIEDIKNKIIEKSENLEMEYVSKEKALERFKNNLKEDKDLLNDYNNENNPIPASIEIKTTAEIQKIVDSIQDMPGIEQITTHINSNPYELYIQKLLEK